MPIETKLYRVLIASPGDVEEERAIVREEIARWNSMHAVEMKLMLLPLGWETDSTPDLRERGQAVINRQLVDSCDLIIGIFWTRIGTPTPEAESGTVEEIERAAAEGRRCIVYFSDKPVPPSDLNKEQYDRLQKYKQKLNERGLTDKYNNIPQFKEKISRHLTKAIQEITKEDKERRAAEQEARTTEQAIGLQAQPAPRITSPEIAFSTLAEAQTSIKQFLNSPFGIQDMEDAVEREIAAVQKVHDSPELATLFLPPNQLNTETISAIAQIIETASTPSMFILSSIGKYGDSSSIDWQEIVGNWVERLSTKNLTNGYRWSSYIKTYPGLLTFYSVGISALRSFKIGFLKEVIERRVYLHETNQECSLLEALDPRYVFYQNLGTLIEPGFERKSTPVSDHLALIIKNKLYPHEEEAKYLDWFDLFEFLVSLKDVQLDRQHPYFGSFTWRTETNRFIIKAIQGAALRQGRLGIAISELFNGTDGFEETVKGYDKIVNKISWDIGRGRAPNCVSKLINLAKAGTRVSSYYELANIPDS